MIEIKPLSERVQAAVASGLIQVSTKDENYSMWKYDRNMTTEDDLELGAFRSIVFSAKTGNILCYAPEKSLSKAHFIELSTGNRDLVITETIEGTMINLFWNPEIEQWEISTRSGIGGNYWYNRNHYGPEKGNSQKTFRQMFIDCMKGDSENTNIGNIPGIDYLSHDYCYSFVIQHPDNHFVYRIRQPSACLVAVYRVGASNQSEAKEGSFFAEWINYNQVCKVTGQLIYAQTAAALGCVSVEVLHEHFSDLDSIQFGSPYPMGYMIMDTNTGHRYSAENHNYAKLKELRGNNPNLQYQYLALNRTKKVTEFLEYFPQYRKQFYQFYRQYHEFVTEIHNAYVKYYVQKNRDPVPKKYFVHVSKIHHNVYLPSLATGNKRIITHRVVRDYFDELNPSAQIYYLNAE